jgi:Myb-like DNA-binding protein FlbD
MSRAQRRGPWVAEEDATLLSLVASRGPNNWVQISQHMHYRSPKQCRERYHQNLKASLNHEPISAHEGEQIEQMVTAMGKKWAEIARRLGNRSDNAVKNWWNGSQNRRKRNAPHQGPSAKTLTNRSQPLSAVRPSRSPVQQHGRNQSHNDPSPRCHQSWQDVGSAQLAQPTFHVRHNQAPDQAYNHERSQFHLHDVNRSQDNAYHSQRALEHPSLPGLHRTGADDHIGQLLPSLGPIITSQAPPLFTSHANHPSLSASSVDRAPSLISDHNSTYSISPKTWPSPRPDIPAPLDTKGSHWHESTHIDRRGSAPAISNMISLPFSGDEGYVSAIPPSASSEHKYLLPTPIGRQACFDGRYNDNHRHCVSNPSVGLSPRIERDPSARDPSVTRDTRMNFSSLLN